MIGLVLAAGTGNRIAGVTNGLPKSWLPLAGKTLIEHQLDALKSHGVSPVVVVVGYRAEDFRVRFADRGLTFVENPDFATTNVLGSVWCAREQMRGGFYFMHADTYFDPAILGRLIADQREIVLAVNVKPSVEEDMKVRVEGDRIVEINKTMDCAGALGEFTGVLKVGPQVAPRVVERVEHRIETLGRRKDFFETVLQDLIDDGDDVNFLDIGEALSIEIDFPEDYAEAQAALEGR